MMIEQTSIPKGRTDINPLGWNGHHQSIRVKQASSIPQGRTGILPVN